MFHGAALCFTQHRSRRPPADPGEPASYSSSTYIILRASSAATPHALAPLPSPLRMFPSHHPPCPHPHYTPTPSLLLPSHALALYPLASCPPPTPYSYIFPHPYTPPHTTHVGIHTTGRHFQMSGADGVDDGGSLDDSEAEKQNANKAVKGASGTGGRRGAHPGDREGEGGGRRGRRGWRGWGSQLGGETMTARPAPFASVCPPP